MMKTVTALAAAGVIATAAVAVPSKAEANPVWLVPAIVAAGIVGVGLTAQAAHAHPAGYAYSPRGAVYVQPRAVANCHIVRERTARGTWRRVQICD
jgi:hypothetical protein